MISTTTYQINADKDGPTTINKEDYWWKLQPITNDKNEPIKDEYGLPIYFRSSLVFQNAWSDQKSINLHFEVNIENESFLPPNLIQSNVLVNNKIYPTVLNRIASEGDTKIKKNWIKVSIPIDELEVDKFEEGIEVPIAIDFYLQKDILDGIKNNLESNALRILIENLSASRITTKITYNNYIFLQLNRGEKEISTKYKGDEKETLSWYQPNYNFLSDLDQIKELLTIKINSTVTIFNYKFIFNYATSANGSSKTIDKTYSKQTTYTPNSEIKFSLEPSYIYDTIKNEVIERDMNNNHYFFLPRGGSGSYNIQINLLVNNVKYYLETSNSFNYFSWLDNVNKLDFIAFFPKTITSLSSYAVLE
ncbi:DUF5443 family protein [Mycoplasma sp. E35C]|uniref:DUF5443 family protein n=1 Tax=Mycoplasma sp. E35C TaxID=2801918 RepID=UPI001CA3AAAC|nr:DUF5443 family protein [Mycoplasma sp. E35C]QZX49333.1 DUF5443 family protein [Mycoplasma sp. E35C]